MYSLFSNIQVVNGVLRSAIYDLQHESFCFIPKQIGEFLTKNTLFEIEDLDEYGKMFLEREFIHYLDKHEIEMFPKMQMDYNIPCVIEVLVFDCLNDITLNIDFRELIEVLKLQKILFYVREQQQINNLKTILSVLKESTICHIEIIFFEKFEDDYDFIDSERRITKIYFYRSDKNKVKQTTNGRLNIYLKDSFNERVLWQQHPNYFNVNLKLFCESLSYNPFYHKRMYIDEKGNISDGEFLPPVANIKHIKEGNELIELLYSKEFQKYWFVHKDICDVCKDCEFRHMCVDNRIPHQRNADEWYHKTECNYNPYICKWQDEEGYRTLSECGVISNEHEFSIDHERIAKINKELWEE